MRWAVLILTLVPSLALCSFELPPLAPPPLPGGSAALRAGYEEVDGFGGYTSLDLFLPPLLLSLRSSSDREGLYGETVLSLAYEARVGSGDLMFVLSYLSCHASGELGRVGKGRGAAVDLGARIPIGPAKLELFTWNLISAVRYHRLPLEGVEGRRYWEGASRDLLLRLIVPLRGRGLEGECGLFGRSPFLGLRWRPSDEVLLEAGWAFGRSIRGGLRIGLRAEVGPLTIGYRHMMGNLGVQSTAVDVTAELR